jgi:hypothetical protein
MGVNLIAVDDGSLGLSGTDQDTGAFIFAQFVRNFVCR